MHCFKSILPFFILFLSKVKAELNGCNEIVISDCDRNYCDRQSEIDFPSAEFCQLTCQFMAGDNSCQSWAFQSAEKVNTIDIRRLIENQRNTLLFFEIVPCHFCRASEVQA